MRSLLPLFRHGTAASLVLLGATFLLPRPAVSDVQLAFDPPNGIIPMIVVDDVCEPSDDTLMVRITVDDQALDLKGFSLVFDFDPLVVTPVSVQAGSLLVAGGCANHFFDHLNAAAPGDSIAIDGAWLGCSVAGPGAIAEIRFVGVSHGNSQLHWRALTLRDSQNEDIAHQVQDGVIDVVCPTSVTRHSWGQVKAIYRSP